jgi:hypothetical protein
MIRWMAQKSAPWPTEVTEWKNSVPPIFKKEIYARNN